MDRPDTAPQGVAALLLGTRDLERAKAFYRDVVGLPPAGEVEGEFAFFRVGATRLGVSVPHARLAQELGGAVEISLAVGDVKATYAALRARGVPFEREPRQIDGDTWGTHFRDPDGHLISILGPRGE